MKILHITDSHATVKGPESRRDVYYVAFLRKMYELGYIIKQQGINYVIHTGDLFHTARVSDKFAGQTAEMMKMWGIPVYVVPGNHDIEGYSTDTIDQTKLGLLAKTEVVTILDRDKPLRLQETYTNGDTLDIAVTGQEYYAHIDEGNMDDFKMGQDDGDLNILCIHGYIADTPQNPNIKCTYTKDIVTDADIILTGHYHRSFEASVGDTMIYNPGSMMRVEQTDYNKIHTPSYGILDIHLDANGDVEYDYQFHTFRVAEPSLQVFDYTAKYQQKVASITLEGFKTSLANTMVSTSPNTDLKILLNNLMSDPAANISTNVYSTTMDLYNATIQNLPDDFEPKQGYIEDKNKKYIRKIKLHNFQSHHDTEIELVDGMNILVGESNNGKTSILRAIMWVVDNQPLGTDFIQAGEKECNVRITYSDGSYIERGRTLKDTGYYKIGYYDVNGVFDEQEYRGFTNAVPVEVDNVHQMPKVNITKDIETHLNLLSQLDAPFLLTESPLVKASAIGRITGVHVIDAAVKEANKTIMGNKKLMKSYEEDLKAKQDEKKTLPDLNIMKAFQQKMHTILDGVTALKEWTEKVEYLTGSIKEMDIKISEEQTALHNVQTFIDFNKKACSIMPVIQDTLQLDEKYTQCVGVENLYRITNDQLKACNIFLRLRPALNTVSELETRVSKYDKFFSDFMDITVKLTGERVKAETNKRAALAYRSLCTHISIESDYINTLKPKMRKIEDLNMEIDMNESDADYQKGELKLLSVQMKQAKKDQRKFILDNKLCPCCGQEITRDHVDNIKSFMEGI